MEKNIVYKIKDGIDLKDFEKFGFIADADKFMLFKPVELSFDSRLVKTVLLNFYENPKWIKEIYKKRKKVFKEKIGLEYDKKGQIVYNEKMTANLSVWILGFDGNDTGYFFLTTTDDLNSMCFYNKRFFEDGAKETVDQLIEEGYIEEVEYEE